MTKREPHRAYTEPVSFKTWLCSSARRSCSALNQQIPGRTSSQRGRAAAASPPEKAFSSGQNTERRRDGPPLAASAPSSAHMGCRAHCLPLLPCSPGLDELHDGAWSCLQRTNSVNKPEAVPGRFSGAAPCRV